MVEFNDRDRIIIAIAIMNASERAQFIPPKLLGLALNELRKVHCPSIKAEELQEYVDAVRNERKNIMADLFKGFSKLG